METAMPPDRGNSGALTHSCGDEFFIALEPRTPLNTHTHPANARRQSAVELERREVSEASLRTSAYRMWPLGDPHLHHL